MSNPNEVPVRIEPTLAAQIDGAAAEMRAQGVPTEEIARRLRARFGDQPITIERVAQVPVERRDVIVNAHGAVAGSRAGRG